MKNRRQHTVQVMSTNNKTESTKTDGLTG